MFGFLKDKLKQWVGKAKETLGIEKAPEEKKPKEKKEKIKKVKEEKVKKEKIKPVKEEKKIKEIIKEIPKEKEIKKEKVKEEVKKIIEIPDIKPKELGTAIEIETELEEGIPEEVIEQELEKKAKEETKIEPIEELKKVPEIRPIAEKEPSEEAEPIQEKKSLFQRLKSTFTYKITDDDFNKLFDDLEMLLLENNVAFEVVENIKKSLSKKLIGKEIKKDNLEEEIRKELKNSLNEILIDPDDPIDIIKLKKEKPFVMLFFGINGTGKTTSIAKIADLLKKNKFSVVLAAADTFRAASIEQISEHAKKLNVHLIKHEYNSDPAAVGFDAIKYAKNHSIDVVLIDTAGRMHTKTNLLAEMEKIQRVTKPDLKIFVAESIAGNDATEQARTFNDIVGIDGSILSKVDVDEKGGTIVSVSYITKKPIFYLGTGQKYTDIRLFNKDEFIKNLGL